MKVLQKGEGYSTILNYFSVASNNAYATVIVQNSSTTSTNGRIPKYIKTIISAIRTEMIRRVLLVLLLIS